MYQGRDCCIVLTKPTHSSTAQGQTITNSLILELLKKIFNLKSFSSAEDLLSKLKGNNLLIPSRRLNCLCIHELLWWIRPIPSIRWYNHASMTHKYFEFANLCIEPLMYLFFFANVPWCLFIYFFGKTKKNEINKFHLEWGISSGFKKHSNRSKTFCSFKKIIIS